MAGGEEKGTSGWPRVEWRPWLFIVGVGSLVTLVNVTSELLEASRDQEAMPWWRPVTWECSSLVVNIILAPLIGWAMRRWSPRADNLARVIPIHLALTIPYSLVHVAGMVGIRKAIYALNGDFYDFTHGVLSRELFYEWRKDVLVYAMFAATYYFFRRYFEQKAAAAPADDRIEIRDGGAAVFVAPSDILFVEAAGNYVEFHTAAKSHLVRGTLATWEAKLTTRGFIRVHRSRLVNRAHVSAIKPTPSGDVEITLSNARTLAGSRRYRSALEAAPAA